MALETLRWYHPLSAGAVYIKIGFPKHNSYKVGRDYDMRLADPEETDEGVYKDAHESVLVGKEEYTVENIPNILLALLSNTRSRQDALQRLGIGDDPLDPSREVYLLTFLRKDKAKEMVVSDIEIIPDKNEKRLHYSE